jgi:DNA modification methylase
MTAMDPVYSHQVWRRYTSPVWMDIDQSLTLNREGAREEKDERHICPLQLQVIERALALYTNPNDIVCTPFLGIGSEAYEALKMKRRAIGIELKESYYNQAVENCKSVELEDAQIDIFSCGEERR